MGRRKIDEQTTRNIQRSHGTYSVSIPIELMREFKWRERQKVVVRRYGKHKLIIEDWKR